MCGCTEHGKCEVCGKEANLRRTYFHYGVPCSCHSPDHFEIKSTCKDCTPTEPEETRVTIKTEVLKQLVEDAVLGSAYRYLYEHVPKDDSPSLYPCASIIALAEGRGFIK